MPYVMDESAPVPMPHTYQGHQMWYRDVDARDPGAMNLDAHFIPRISGQFITMCVHPVSGDITGLNMSLWMAMADEEADEILGAESVGEPLLLTANEFTRQQYSRAQSGEFAPMWAASRVRPQIMNSSRLPGVCHIGIIQSPLIG